jgi:hypothetical protein
MAFTVDENGNISLIQGDSATLVIDGIDTDKNYTVYFGIKDKNREPIGSELFVNSNNLSCVAFELTADFTNLLTVGKNENAAIYYYGIKVCDPETQKEDTLIISGDIGTLNTITVYPKKVEGI